MSQVGKGIVRVNDAQRYKVLKLRLVCSCLYARRKTKKQIPSNAVVQMRAKKLKVIAVGAETNGDRNRTRIPSRTPRPLGEIRLMKPISHAAG